MGLFDSMFGAFGGVGGMLLGGMNQYAKSLGMDDEELAAFNADMMTGTLNATTALNQKRTEERKRLSAELAKRPKPGGLCDPRCWIDDDRCRECLAQQQQVQDAFSELQKMENAANRPTAANTGKKPTKCSLCGAPIVKGVGECPYCSTAYPSSVFSGNSAYGTADQAKVAAHGQGQRVCVMFAELMQNIAKRLAETGEYSKLFKFTPASLEATWCKYAMTADQVLQGANQYGVSRSAYIAGVIGGTFTSVSETIYKEQKEKERQQQRERQEKEKQLLRERQERERQASNENFRRQLEMASGSPVQYVGGPQSVGYCCGNCIHYMKQSNQCAYSRFFHPKNASDYCNYHRSR